MRDAKLFVFCRLFNQQKFFEAHEVLESAWLEAKKNSSENSKNQKTDFYQGLIQIAAALVHVQNANSDGAEKLFSSASGYLKPFLPKHENLDLEKLLETTRQTVFLGKPFPQLPLPGDN